MRTIAFAAASAISISLLLVACGEEKPTSSEELQARVDVAMENLRKDKEDLTAELRALREDLAVERTRAEERLKDPKLTAEQRKEWGAFKDDVDTQISRIDRHLEDVGSATAETWEKVKAATKKAAEDVGDWFRRQAEKVDRKTRTDLDNDMH